MNRQLYMLLQFLFLLQHRLLYGRMRQRAPCHRLYKSEELYKLHLRRPYGLLRELLNQRSCRHNLNMYVLYNHLFHKWDLLQLMNSHVLLLQQELHHRLYMSELLYMLLLHRVYVQEDHPLFRHRLNMS